MTQHNSRSKDETEILALIERWAQAVRDQISANSPRPVTVTSRSSPA